MVGNERRFWAEPDLDRQGEQIGQICLLQGGLRPGESIGKAAPMVRRGCQGSVSDALAVVHGVLVVDATLSPSSAILCSGSRT